MWVRLFHISLRAAYVPGIGNILPDKLSRVDLSLSERHNLLSSRHVLDQREWVLSQEVLQAFFLQLGYPQVDLFATNLNKRLPVFCSIYLSQNALPTGRFCSQLGQNPRICISADFYRAASDPVSDSGQSHDHSHSPQMAQQALVLGSSPVPHSRSDQPSTSSRSTVSERPSVPGSGLSPTDSLAPFRDIPGVGAF